MNEQKCFYDRLFNGRIVWAMHTAMTYDCAYVGALMDKQQGDQASYEAPQCAFFYDVNKQPAPICGGSPEKSVKKLQEHVFTLEGEQTHHAKISLVCYGENQYRLAVYSKNLQFSGNIDAALLFELEIDKKPTESGKQLCAYLKKLHDISDKKGKNWLNKNITNDVKAVLEKCKLKSEFGSGRYAELYFGGCNNVTNLGSLLRLNEITDNSIVLTPPIFITGNAQNFFVETKKILYDHKSKPSHIKLYLLERTIKETSEEKKYELWVGSANATPCGLGWYFNDHKISQSASIECLVKFDIDQAEFTGISSTINGEYYKYDDFSKQSNFNFTPDQIGPYIVKNFECEEVSYDTNSKQITVTLKKTLEKKGEDDANNLDLSQVKWRPLEYSEDSDADFTKLENDKITITYKYENFRSAQGYLVFGTSCCMMDISDKLKDIELVKDNIYKKDTRLTNWLLKPDDIPTENDDKWTDKLKWMREVLSGSTQLPVIDQLPHSADKPRATPMQFQKNGAKRLHEILKVNSRAFLADEPGLGKTFTAAMLIDEMTKDYYSHNKGKPFYVIYVAPNKTLISKCGDDLVKKFNDISHTVDGSKKDAILISDLASPKENLKRAYDLFYESLTKKRNYEKSKVKELIEKFEDSEFNNFPRTLSPIADKIKEEFKSQTQSCHFSPPKWSTLRPYYYDEKALIPDRLAFAHEIMKNANNIGEKVVIIGVSAEIALKEDPSSDAEKTILGEKKRTEFTKGFLEHYHPRLIIWDEYHRYFNKNQNDNNNPFFDFEENSDMKSLFVSATPYKTNISGEEDKKALKELYQLSQTRDPNESLDESPDVKLPSFDEFAKLFCGGKSKIKSDDVKKAYQNMTENGNKTELEANLKKRMIRNERTRLQGYYEKHIPLYDKREQYDSVHAEILKNTAKQCRLLKEAGYSEGALTWSFSLPWMLCFSTSRTASRCNNGYTYFERLNPQDKELSDKSSDLFVYDDSDSVSPKDSLKTLPRQNLAMHQICEKNLPDRRAAQLLWMPPTIPLYKSGDNSIFTKYAGYSKLLVFAEFRYLQRGGALLLSDYTRLLCKTEEEKTVPEEFKLEALGAKDIEDFDFLTGDHRNQTLDELLDSMPGDDTVTKLYKLASPAACAIRLNLDPKELTDAFNEYFNSAGVKEALWSWLCDNGFDETDKREEGILRYCAEGNLYAVLEEWLLCIKENDPGKQLEHICSILQREPSQVGVQTLETTRAKGDGIPRYCGFAEQLTGDVNDVGSGENEEATRRCSQAFDSPFYPMILFAGKGAQEGIDMHNYCLRIMHLTLPRGAVSYEQRNGRIDRYRSLLVRRRAAEFVENMQTDNTSNLIARAFAYLEKNKHQDNKYPKNHLYPNWSIRNPDSKWHFEELMPVWEYTEKSCFADTVIEMYKSYRTSLGVNESNDSAYIDLSTIDN